MMNEPGHPLLPLSSPDPYLRVNWEDEGHEGSRGDVRDPGDSRTSLLSVPAETLEGSDASYVSTASTITQSRNTKEALGTGAGQPAGDPRKRHCFPATIRNWQWKFEIILLLLSICSLAAIILVLAVYDGHPLGSWQFYFSLNTIISVLGTISRSSLASAVGSCLAQEKWNWFRKRQDHLYMFDRIDNASRGSLGSFKLLFWMKFYHWTSLGAVTIVVLLAYDPFVQAIVIQTGQNDNVSSGRDAVIGSALRLDTGILASQAGGAEAAQEWTDTGENVTCVIDYYTHWSSQPDLGMVASVYAGFDNQSSSPLRKTEFTCRTGNCTWTPFTSLAVCASCRDATALITSSTHNASEAMPGGHTDGVETVFSLPLNNITNWDSISHAEAVGKKRGEGMRISGNSVIMSAQGTVNGSALYSFRNSTTFLFGFSIMHADEGYLNGSVPWNDSRPIGTECGLELCTNIYRSEVKEGVLAEGVLYSSAERDMQSLLPGFYPPGDGPDKCGSSWNQLNNNSLYYGYAGDSQMAIDRSDLVLHISEEDAAQHGVPRGQDAEPLLFNITDQTLKSTIAWMKGEFASGHLVWYNAITGTGLNFYQDGTFWNQTAVASSLVDRLQLAQTFARVADSMTVWARNLGYSDTPVYGTTTSWVLHTRVRWPFIAFPIATTLAGCVFCCFVILETRRLGLRPWRDSCLAIMAHGINDEMRDQLRQADNAEKVGRNMNIRLADGQHGPGLLQS